MEQMGVNVIEVGYPGLSAKDVDDVYRLSKHLKTSVLCGLACTKPAEIMSLVEALKPARQGRMHLYTSVRLPTRHANPEELILRQIQAGVELARQYCADVEWSALDATRADRAFLCRAVEMAIASGATTINIPDSLGVATPTDFTDLLTALMVQVPNLDQATLSVHCHDDLGYAVENSMAALGVGVRQVECSIRGLGARQGNADLGAIVRAIAQQPAYETTVNLSEVAAIEAALMEMLPNLYPAP
jgi:2-isopropylmalate synthase